MSLTPDQWFSRCANEVLQKEGWDTYTNTPGDRGGPTRFGITLATLSNWRGKPCVASDVQNLSENEALSIYRQNYWHLIAGDQLPPGINLAVFDCSVNQGPGHAVRWIQAAAGVLSDGVIGPATLRAINQTEAVKLLEIFKQERLSAYENDSGWTKFGHGWTNRDDEITTLAEQWASES